MLVPTRTSALTSHILIFSQSRSLGHRADGPTSAWLDPIHCWQS